MGKRSKDKALLGTASRRRAVLQIEPVSRRKELAAEVSQPSSDAREINPTSISGIGLLGQYADYSDDEQDEYRGENGQPATGDPSAGNDDQLHRDKEVHIESKLDDFFKEIAAISSEDAASNREVASEPPTEENAVQDTIPTADTSQAMYTVSYPWETVCDPNTNYIYYWNTLTNEVSWETPQQSNVRLPENNDISEEDPSPATSRDAAPYAAHVSNVSEEPAMPATQPMPLVQSPQSVVTEDVVEPPYHDPVASTACAPAADKPECLARVCEYSDETCEPVECERDEPSETVTHEEGVDAKDDIGLTTDSATVESEDDEGAVREDGDLTKAVAEEMPEYPPTPENISPDELSDPGEPMVDEVAQNETSKTDDENNDVPDASTAKDQASSTHEDEEGEKDVTEIPAKKAKYDHSDHESDEDFAEKLLDEFFDGKSPEAEVETESAVEAVQDDMDVDSQSESEDEGRIEDNTAPLLPPEAFKHNLSDNTVVQETVITPDSLPQSEPDKLKNEQDEKTMEEIFDLSGLLISKLGFLNISKEGLNKLQLVLVQIETRIKDWREGALSSQYLLRRLHEADDDLKRHEESAAPEGWSCHWDSSYKRYFYTDNNTGESQWDYPQVNTVTAPTVTPYSTNTTTSALWGTTNTLQSTASVYQSMLTPTADQTSIYGTTSASQTAYPDTNTEATTATSNLLAVTQDPYRVDENLLDDDDDDDDENNVEDRHPNGSTTPPPPGESPPPPPPDMPTIPPPPPPSEDMFLVVPPPPPPAGSTFSAVPRNLVDYSDLEAVSGHEPFNTQENVTQAANSPRSSPVLTLSTIVKTKKKKSKSSVPIRTSKVKKMSSLVQRWQSIKKQDEVLSEEESDEEETNAKNQANIQQWRKEQIVSGQAFNNPNFQEIKGDWRERVRKAKMRTTTGTKEDSPNP